jgi:zinc D-Ala-D-Ala carboxypeptidase
MNVSADPVQTYTADTWPANRWPNFSFAEMACRETGECLLDGALMDALQRVRAICGPLTVTSGYRSPRHSKEAAKGRSGGPHTLGKAADIRCAGTQAFEILHTALDEGFTGIGIDQRGEDRFLHLDVITHLDDFPAVRPTIWSY